MAKTEKKVEEKKSSSIFNEEVKYIIAKIKRSKNPEVCHYSYLLKSTLNTLANMGIKYREMGSHSYGFTVPDKRSAVWRRMCIFGKQRDEKGHFIKE